MNKYRAKPTVIDGIRFASQAEARRYEELLLLKRAKEIVGLEFQYKMPIFVGGRKICTYIADFRYQLRDTGQDVIEDVKGVKTSVYSLKKKLVEATYGITITEVKA